MLFGELMTYSSYNLSYFNNRFCTFLLCRRVADYSDEAESDNLSHYREKLLYIVRQELQHELFSDLEVGRRGKEVSHGENKDVLPKNSLEE